MIDWPISPKPNEFVDSIWKLTMDMLFMSLRIEQLKSVLLGTSELLGASLLYCFSKTCGVLSVFSCDPRLIFYTFMVRWDFYCFIEYLESSFASGLNVAFVDVFKGTWSSSS